MAEARRTPGRTPTRSGQSRRLAIPEAGWRTDARVVRLTEQINRVQRQTAERVVDAVIEIGRRMAEVRERLDHGQWRAWATEAVPFTTRTIANYTALAGWSDASPDEVERLAHLGPTKLYLLAGLPARARRRLTSSRPHTLPDGRRKTIAIMTVAELAELVAGERGLAIAPRRPPIDRVLGRMRHRIAGLEAIADELVRRRAEVDGDEALELRNELVELVEAIDQGFGL